MNNEIDTITPFSSPPFPSPSLSLTSLSLSIFLSVPSRFLSPLLPSLSLILRDVPLPQLSLLAPQLTYRRVANAKLRQGSEPSVIPLRQKPYSAGMSFLQSWGHFS